MIVKNPTYLGYQNRNTSQIFLFDGYVKVSEALIFLGTIWVDTILNHVDTTAILPRTHKSSWMVYRPKWYHNYKYHQIPIPYLYENK